MGMNGRLSIYITPRPSLLALYCEINQEEPIRGYARDFHVKFLTQALGKGSKIFFSKIYWIICAWHELPHGVSCEFEVVSRSMVDFWLTWWIAIFMSYTLLWWGINKCSLPSESFFPLFFVFIPRGVSY